MEAARKARPRGFAALLMEAARKARRALRPIAL
jgi:hypothetical protein